MPRSDPRSAHEALDLSAVPPEVVDAYNLDALPVDRPLASTADLLRLDGKVALVTGGGGAGLGNAICHRLAEQGATIAIVDVDAEAGSFAADDIAQTWGVETLSVRGNVADWDAAHDAVQEVAVRFGTIDIAVNNAGGSGSVGARGSAASSRGTFAAMDRQSMEVTVGVNLMGVFHVTSAVLEVMLPRHSGRIINISSEGAKFGAPGLAVYGSCKAAVNGFTANLAHEVGPEGVTVVAVCPGTMVSQRLLQPGYLSPTLDGLLGSTFRRTPIGRLSLLDEVASMVAFLASDAGSYVHGTSVSVGGGISD